MGLVHGGRSPLRVAGTAALLSVATVALAQVGALQTTAPEAVSLLLEPFSLLLMPGVALAMVLVVTVGHLKHHVLGHPEIREFTSYEVLLYAALFYLLVYGWLLWRRKAVHGKL